MVMRNLLRGSRPAARQSKLLWQLRWPEYDDTKFLDDSLCRYQMMLNLMRLHPDQFIVPTYDIDNIWHTHLAYPARYFADCLRVVGHDVGHDDSENDRSEGSKLRVSAKKTELLWNAEFPSRWRKQGAMYRGEPPDWYWSDRERAAAASSNVDESNLLGRFRECTAAVLGVAIGAANEV